MKSLGIVGWFAMILLLIGGLNLGFFGVFDYNVLQGIFGNLPALLRTIYVFIGLSAFWLIYLGCKHK
ncbi:MAG: DUF378 domain-containing protein [Coxiella sp. RIFCSPHIGHO2_12_FULL_44_14]|nr:MAG: DUF378 domain-containing protein [Coxiella sp. RIFCSPHIGHO2_12_FULL_44_14]